MRRAGRTCVAALRSVACALEEALALRRTLSFLQAVCQCRKADKTAEKSPLLPARGGRGRQNVWGYRAKQAHFSSKIHDFSRKVGGFCLRALHQAVAGWRVRKPRARPSLSLRAAQERSFPGVSLFNLRELFTFAEKRFVINR